MSEREEALKNAKLTLKKYFIDLFVYQFKNKLNILYNKSLDNKLKKHIKYIEECELIFESSGDLPLKNIKKLNNLWEKYKTA